MRKEILYYSDEIKSHSDKSLINHLREVNTEMHNLYKDDFPIISDYDIKNHLKEIIDIISFSHDFGKASAEFQKKLCSRSCNDKLSRHGLISALFGLFLAKNIYKLSFSVNFLIFNIIKHHHGNLDNGENNLFIEFKSTDIYKDDITNCKESLNNIPKDYINCLYKTLLNKENVFEGYSCFLDKLQIRNNEVWLFKKMEAGKLFNNDSDDGLNYYFIFNYFYSILLEADKKSASGSENNVFTGELNVVSVEEYKNNKFKNNITNLGRIREKINQIAIKSLKHNYKKTKTYSLTSPTGSGKTLTMLSCALWLREELYKKKKVKYKIIYALPFLSIIEQNYEIIKDVLEESMGKDKVGNDVLLAHHHLSDKIYKVINDEQEELVEKNFNESNFLIENWYSEIIVTTFYQLFKSVFTNKNKLLKKYNKLINTIILIDEIQALPPRLFRIIKIFIKIFSEHYGTYFIIGTATNPNFKIKDDKYNLKHLYELYRPNKKLIKEQENYFNRYMLDVSEIDNYWTFEDLANAVLKDLQKGLNILIVLNTIKSTRIIYEKMSKLISEKYSYDIFYLATTVTPKQRIGRINQINDQRSKRKKIIISTQLIEAGVDLSVDKIYRDFAPLDCIVQTSGRCNRHNDSLKGRVKIVNLIDENTDIPYSKYIYKTDYLLDTTREVLASAKNKIIEETELLPYVKDYFNRLSEKISSGVVGNIDLVTVLKKLEFQTIEEKFVLIDNKFTDFFSFFIIYEHQSKIIWDEFKDIRNMRISKKEDMFERKKRFNNIKKRFYENSVKLNFTFNKKTEMEVNLKYLFNDFYREDKLGVFCIDLFNREHENYYDKNYMGLNIDKLKYCENLDGIII